MKHFQVSFFQIILGNVFTLKGEGEFFSCSVLALCCDLMSLAEDEEIAAFYVLPNVLTVDTLP